MTMSRQLFLSAALALLPLATAAPATAAALPVQVVDKESVTWTIPAGQCPRLPASLSVTGTGNHNRVTTTDIHSDGSAWQSINDIVQGTAKGSDGSEYDFFYSNYSTYQTPAGVQPVLGGPIPPAAGAGVAAVSNGSSGNGHVNMYDTFLLQSRPPRADNHYVIMAVFVYSWDYTPPAGPFDAWPPANWQHPIEYGNPTNHADFSSVCDPI